MTKVVNDGKSVNVSDAERLCLLSRIYSLSGCRMGFDHFASKPADQGLHCFKRYSQRFMKV